MSPLEVAQPFIAGAALEAQPWQRGQSGRQKASPCQISREEMDIPSIGSFLRFFKVIPRLGACAPNGSAQNNQRWAEKDNPLRVGD